ncbi:sensor histidine kinase [Streptomyces albidus (ex Kaewkla and Franco 2022)]|uniref:sensor histidine kinase n=1 Tax=Streptomyces albidus (ex Kaewkla and Franco 2022) TaxID=722709 RepID=UPI0015EF0455|nr:histidine kinase [Streptomyces albidus (ex Kaewkla and Franco 2022)]
MTGQWQGLAERRPAKTAKDPAWGLAAALLFTLASARETAVSADLAGPLWANVLCAAGMTPPMLAGRRRPTLTVLLALSAAMAQTSWLTPSTQLAMPLLAVLVAAFVAGRYAPSRTTALVLLAACLSEEWAGPIAVNADPLEDALFVSVALWAAWLLGRSGLARERLAHEAEARRHAEHEREARIRAAVAAERRAVARDLHDTVAHAVTLMVLQATGTRLVARERPEAAESALGTIEKAGRRAMEDLRAMLHVLRHDDADGPSDDVAHADTDPDTGPVAGGHSADDAGPPAPSPGLDDLHALVEGARESGLDATLEPLPEGGSHPPSLTAAAYRTVQEGLTNAVRHAPGSKVRVSVCATGERLTVSVDNGAPAGPVPAFVHGTGTGLIGLRERVSALGGAMSAEPREDGGFALSVELPRNTP